MDWNGVVEHNKEALRRILSRLFGMAAGADGMLSPDRMGMRDRPPTPSGGGRRSSQAMPRGRDGNPRPMPRISPRALQNPPSGFFA